MTTNQNQTADNIDLSANDKITHDDYASNAFASMLQHCMYVNHHSKGVIHAPEGFENDLHKQLLNTVFLVTFNYRSMTRSSDVRHFQLAAGDMFLRAAFTEVEKIMEGDPVEKATNEYGIEHTPYGIMFPQFKPVSFRKKFWDDTAFDIVLIVHPETLPAFKQFINIKNQNTAVVTFEKTFPFSSAKITRYSCDQAGLDHQIEQRVAMMDSDDFKPLFKESYSFLHELPSRAHFKTPFYDWQENLSELGDQHFAAIAEIGQSTVTGS